MAIAHKNIEPVEEQERPIIAFRGHVFEPLLSGALFWPEKNTLLVADLHFEKMASFARSGQLLPPYDTGATISRLAYDVEMTSAARVICLGDSFHRDESAKTLAPSDKGRLLNLVANHDWIWLAGNHDPLPHALGGRCQQIQTFGNIILSHEPDPGLVGQIAGHLHPSARVLVNGRSVRRPCFIHDDNLMILPAYGVSTGSLNVLSDPIYSLFEPSKLCITMLGKNRLYQVSTKKLVGD